MKILEGLGCDAFVIRLGYVFMVGYYANVFCEAHGCVHEIDITFVTSILAIAAGKGDMLSCSSSFLRRACRGLHFN